jgi:hypothetical protein
MVGQLVLYWVVKAVAYAAWCLLGLHLAGRGVRPAAAFGLGLVRVALGFAGGTALFFAARAWSIEGSFPAYVGLYAPLRALEWTLLFALMRGPVAGRSWTFPKAILWIAGGVVLSFVTEWASPLSMGERLGHARLTC